MFSVTADGVQVNEGDLVYGLSGAAWRVDCLELVDVDEPYRSADRTSINKFYSSRRAALSVGLDIANRKLKEATDAYATATDQRMAAFQRLQAEMDSEQDRINEAAALPYLGGAAAS